MSTSEERLPRRGVVRRAARGGLPRDRRRAGRRSPSRAPHDDPLLSAKLAPPDPRPGLIRRTRLFDLIDSGVAGPLTLIAAPAGAGKTVLLSSWIAERRKSLPVAWVSLDAADNEPARLWGHLLGAMRRTGPAARRAVRGLEPPSAVSTEAFVRRFAAALGELDQPLVVVLDDFHDLRAAVASQFEFLVAHAPPTLRLVISTRSDPVLQLHRLRLQGDLLDIREADLAFTLDESEELLATYGIAVSAQDASALHARTEGWAAGLRLAILSLQGAEEPSKFIAELAGTDRSIAGYLVEQVLDTQPEHIRQFLLRTSVADRLTGDLADALTGRTDGAETLDWLVRSNALVFALDSVGTAYRYHRLFADLLQNQLHAHYPELVPQLYRRAARWSVASRHPLDAIRYAVRASDWRHAADLLRHHWIGLTVRGEVAAVRDLLTHLPGEEVDADPELAAAVAGTGLYLGDARWSRRHLETAAERGADLPSPRRERVLAAVTLEHACLAEQEGDYRRVAELTASAPDLPGEADSEYVPVDGDLRAMLASYRGPALVWLGDWEAAWNVLQQGLRAAVPAECDQAHFNCLGYLALLDAFRGRLTRAVATASSVAEVLDRRGSSALIHAASGYLALAWVDVERARPTRALQLIDRADTASKSLGEPGIMAAAAVLRARVHGLAGELDRGLATVAEARAAINAHPDHITLLLAIAEAELLLASGDAVGTRLTLAPYLGRNTVLHAEVLAIWAQSFLLDGAADAAAELLEPMATRSAPNASWSAMVTLWTGYAIACRATGATERAAGAFERALTVAAAEGIRRPFATWSAPVHDLLAAHLGQLTAHRDYIGELLDALPVPAVAPAAGTWPALVQPLSGREREVLRYLPCPMSNNEIASQMFISRNTLKTHLRSIYWKLEVESRHEAVRRARDLRLL